jgi:hypothetical protein
MSGETGKESKTMNEKITARRTSPRRRALGVALLTLCAWLVAVSAASAAPTAAWSLTDTTYPTNFEPEAVATLVDGPGFNLTATNVGSVPTSGTYTIRDTLPAGLSPSSEGGFGLDQFGHELTCVTAAQTVTCTGTDPVVPGEWVSVIVPVDVAPGAASGLSDNAVVEGGNAGSDTAQVAATITASSPAFDFLSGAAGLYGTKTMDDGSTVTQAGAHPYQYSIGMSFPFNGTGQEGSFFASGGGVRDISVTLPRGMVVDPTAVPTCTEAQLETLVQEPGEPVATASCPKASQVGTVTVATSLIGPEVSTTPLYNMVPPPGAPAELGFNALRAGIFVHLVGSVRSNGEYELSADAADLLSRPLNPVFGAEATLWGSPTDASHDTMRGACVVVEDTCTLPTRSDAAFVTMPSSCRADPLVTEARADAWVEPGVFKERSDESVDLAGNPVGTQGCDQLDFEPTIKARPTTEKADAPSGLDFSLHIPQDEDFDDLASANLKDTRVTLPVGLSVNPAAADGLGSCTTGQIGMQSAQPLRFDEAPNQCPNASKVGTLSVRTPLLGHDLPGAVYLAKPFDNPFGSLIALYLAVEDEEAGIVAKLAGEVRPDPKTGQLTAVFTDNPELPLEDVDLHFFDGPRGSLQTPPVCGSFTTTSVLTPWSEPEGADATPADTFQVTQPQGGGSCPASEAAAPNHPAFSAGTVTPAAGAFSPFVLRLSREDGSQRLGSVDVTLPRGLTGKLAGTPYCPEPQIAAATARSNPNEGAVEQASPSCPAASEVGTVSVAAGAGPTPLRVQGRAYLAGPYKGAPLSMAIVTPAVAGPFDLGVVVVRSALYVDPSTAQITVRSDPIPTILQGVPLDLRSVSVDVGKPGFTLNPTSCDPTAVGGRVTSVLGQVAELADRFQVGGCSGLRFAPKLDLRLFGPTKRNGHPRFRATVTARPGEANIAGASVALPHSEFLEQSHINTICTRVQFAADACPDGSIYGHARAITPLLDQPLEGPVYLRSSSNPLPDLVAALRGQVEIDLVGRIDSVHGGIRNTFQVVPDAPVSKFVLEMKGGRKGLLVNSRNLCRGKPSRATVNFVGQNGKTHAIRPVLRNQCGRKKEHRHHSG